MNVLFHYAAGPDLAARLAAMPGLRITVCPEDDDALLQRLLPDTDVLWHVLKRCTAAMIAAAPRLKLIQKIGVGVNTIDLEAAKARGIPVCNLPGTNSRAVAELTLALMLAVLRRLPRFDAAMRRGVWTRSAAAGRYRRTGRTRCRAGGLRCDPAPAGAGAGRDWGAGVIYTDAARQYADALGEWRSLPALLAEADVVSLHVPLTDGNREPDRRRGAGAHEARRGADQHRAWRPGGSGGADRGAAHPAVWPRAGLDVFETSRPTSPTPLFRLPNVVLTPHVAWLTTGTFDRSFALAAENCRRLAAGEALLHRVV